MVFTYTLLCGSLGHGASGTYLTMVNSYVSCRTTPPPLINLMLNNTKGQIVNPLPHSGEQLLARSLSIDFSGHWIRLYAVFWVMPQLRGQLIK